MARKKFKESFSYKLLKALAMGGSIVLASSNPYFGLKIGEAFKRELSRKKWGEFHKEINKLKRKKRINVSQNSDGSYNVEITNLGKNLVSKYNLDDLIIKQPEQWDGFWRFCSFDIPGPKKQARQALLFKLKKLGFFIFDFIPNAFANPCIKVVFPAPNSPSRAMTAPFFVLIIFFAKSEAIF